MISQHSAVREITKSSSTFSATSFNNYILELLQPHDTIKTNQIKHESTML